MQIYHLRVYGIATCLYFHCQLAIVQANTFTVKENVRMSHMVVIGRPGDPAAVTEVFETINGISVQNCVEQCKKRAVCGFINYRFNVHHCYIIKHKDQSQAANVTVVPGYATSSKEDWDMSMYADCGVCEPQQTCIHDGTMQGCTFTSCGAPAIPDNMVVWGNVYSSGSRLVLRCIDGTQPQNGLHAQITCQSTGDWTTTNFTCIETTTTTTTSTSTTTTTPTTTTITTTTPTVATTSTPTTTTTTTSPTTTTTTTPTTTTTTPTTTTTTTTTPTTTTPTTTTATTAPLFPCPAFDAVYRTFQLEDASNVTYKIVQTTVTQAEARAACQADGGELINTATAARMNFILKLRACTGAPSVDIWVDGVYNTVDLLWHTADGGVIPVPWSYWSPGKPDALYEQFCNRLLPSNYYMDNQVCTNGYSYMCELP